MLEPFEDICRDDFLKSDWESIISECEIKESHTYHSRFIVKAREAQDNGDIKRCRIYQLFADVSSLMLSLDTPEKVFKPLFVSPSGRSVIVDDFDESHLQFFSDIVADIESASVLQARIADVLWFRYKRYGDGEVAVKAYLKSAEALEGFQHWGMPFSSIERARQVSIRLGKNAQTYDQVLEYIENLLTVCNGEDPFLLSHKLMGLLIERGEGDPAKYAPFAEKLALRAETGNDWEKARQYWEVESNWHKIAKSSDKEKTSKIRAAECYSRHAEQYVRMNPPQYGVASHWQQSAVEAMRRVPGMKELTKELHATLLAYQENSVDELKPISHSISSSSLVSAAIAQVSGKDLSDALLGLAWMSSSPKVDELRSQTEQHRVDYALRRMFSTTVINAMGRVIGRRPDDEDEALLWDMFDNANFFRSIHVQALVEPARQQILSEHYVRLADFAPFVLHSPFVREGREDIIARGLYAGLQGDMLTAVHFLVPQLEDSLRHILHQLKVITSGLDDGIQPEYNLNQILVKQEYIKPLTDVLGEDFLFDLRGLLVERPGANLRNDMAHGLISHNAFYSISGYYLWWLALRFYSWHTVVNLKTEILDSDADTLEQAELDEPLDIL